MGIISCVRCLLRGKCIEPTREPNTKCAAYQLDWTLEEKLNFLRERGAIGPRRKSGTFTGPARRRGEHLRKTRPNATN
jgi:hypothetical protein